MENNYYHRFGVSNNLILSFHIPYVELIFVSEYY